MTLIPTFTFRYRATYESVKPFSDEIPFVAAAEEYAEGMSAQLLSERSDEIRADADEQIADAKEKLADGQKKYDDAKKDYDKGLNEYNKSYSQINEQKKELTDAKKDIEDGRKELAENEEKMNALAATCTQIDDILKIYEKAYVKVLPEELLNESRSIQQVYDDNDIEASISDLLAVFIITNPDKDLQSKTAAQAAITGVNEQVRAASAGALEQISAQKWQLDKSEEEIDKGLEELSAYDSDLAKAKHELDSGKKKLDEAQADIDSANAEIADAESELEDKLADGEWYVWNRDEFNPGCMSYGRDAERIDFHCRSFPRVLYTGCSSGLLHHHVKNGRGAAHRGWNSQGTGLRHRLHNPAICIVCGYSKRCGQPFGNSHRSGAVAEDNLHLLSDDV